MHKQLSEDFKKRMLAEFGDDPILKCALDNGESLYKWFKPYILVARTTRDAHNEIIVALQLLHLNNPQLPVGEALRRFTTRRGLFEEYSPPLKQVA